MKRLIAAITLFTFAACQDHESKSSTSTYGGDTTINKADSLLNNPGTGYGNETSDTIGISKMGSGTDTSGSLEIKGGEKNP